MFHFLFQKKFRKFFLFFISIVAIVSIIIFIVIPNLNRISEFIYQKSIVPEWVFDREHKKQTIIAPNGSVHQVFGIALLPTPNNQILLTEQYCRNLIVLKEDTIVKKIPIAIPNRRISISHHRVDETVSNTDIDPSSLPPSCQLPQDYPISDNVGLLGIAIDPDYNANNFIYLAVTLHNTNNSNDTAYSNHAILRVQYNPTNMNLAPITEANIIVEDTNRPFSGSNRSSGGRMLFCPIVLCFLPLAIIIPILCLRI